MSSGVPPMGGIVMLPMELANVPRQALQGFLLSFSRGLLTELAIPPAIVPDDRLVAAVAAVGSRTVAGPPTALPPLPLGVVPPVLAAAAVAAQQQQLEAQMAAAAQLQAAAQQLQARQLASAASAAAGFDVRLEWRHVCQNYGCLLDDCQLCRNNPAKVCDDASVFDGQYWVRDDGKGGQIVRAKCGAEVLMQVIDRGTNLPMYLPDVKIKLYIVNGASSTAPSLHEPVDALLVDDDGHLLFSVAGVGPEEDGGVAMETTQDDRLGPVTRFPELQFLNKNSKFRAGGRTFKAFRLLARAVRRDAVTGAETAVAQVESEPFKVTTKKGYDGCRKAEYLNAREVITDKTFPNMGETTINNLKMTFAGVDSVEDLLGLTDRAANDPKLEASLREVLNMARDPAKWRNLTRILHEKVVWDDSAPRMWMLPNAVRPLGLLFPAHKGQAEFSGPAGVVTSQPSVGGPTEVSALTEDLQLYCGRELEQLTQLAVQAWRLPRHPGWRMAGDQIVWKDARPEAVSAAFKDSLGSGDPSTVMMQSLLLGSPAPGNSGPLPVLGAGPTAMSPGTPLTAGMVGAAGAGAGAAGAAVGGLGGVSAPMSLSGTTGEGHGGPAGTHTAQSGERPSGQSQGGDVAAAIAAARQASATPPLSGMAARMASAASGSPALQLAGAPSGAPLLTAGGRVDPAALAAMPVWEKAAVLQQAIRESWPATQVQAVLACLTDEEITAIRMVHAQQMQSQALHQRHAHARAHAHVQAAAAMQQQHAAAAAAGQRQQAAHGGAASVDVSAAMEALMGDAAGAAFGPGHMGGGGAGYGSGDADAIIEAAVMEAAAAAKSAGALAKAARAMAEGGSGRRGGEARAEGAAAAGGGDDEGDAIAAFSVEELRDLRGHLLTEAGGAERSFDSLSLPSINDQDGWATLLEDLRRVSSTSQHSNPSFNATDWIPENLGRSADGEEEPPAQTNTRVKRERSNAFAQRNHQAALLQAIANNDSHGGDTLRAMLKGDHTSSFGRHMPAPRVGSASKDAATRAAAVIGRTPTADNDVPAVASGGDQGGG